MKTQPFIKSTRDGRQSSIYVDWAIFWLTLRSNQWAHSKRLGLTPVSEPSRSLRKIHGRVTGEATGDVREEASVKSNFSHHEETSPVKWVATLHHNNTRRNARFAPFYCITAAMLLLLLLEREETNAIFWISKSTLRPFSRVSACYPGRC